MNAPMKRHPALVALSRDHHDGLVIAQVLKHDVPAYRGMPDLPKDRLDFFKAKLVTALRPHFELEEKTLFPLLRNRDPKIDHLLDNLIVEHRELENAALIPSDDPDLEMRLDTAGRLLERHIRSEERELFQWAQAHLSGQELQMISEAFGAR
jgi:hemerythrin-like domain-containing protein